MSAESRYYSFGERLLGKAHGTGGHGEKDSTRYGRGDHGRPLTVREWINAAGFGVEGAACSLGELCPSGRPVECEIDSHVFISGTLPESAAAFECEDCGLERTLPAKLSRYAVRVFSSHQCQGAGFDEAMDRVFAAVPMAVAA
jgi:hypothetical protein